MDTNNGESTVVQGMDESVDTGTTPQATRSNRIRHAEVQRLQEEAANVTQRNLGRLRSRTDAAHNET